MANFVLCIFYIFRACKQISKAWGTEKERSRKVDAGASIKIDRQELILSKGGRDGHAWQGLAWDHEQLEAIVPKLTETHTEELVWGGGAEPVQL